MIQFKRVDHISMAAPDWRKQSALLERLLGFKFLSSWDPTPGADFDGCVSQVRGTGIEFEVITPIRPDSFVQKFLDQQGPGLHHITIEVADIKETAAEIERLGLTPFGGITDDGAWLITYLHPKESGGVLWQLFEPYKRGGDHDRNAGGGITDVQRVDHVSVAVPNLDRQVEFQSRVLGMVEEERWRDERLGYDGVTMTIPNSLLKFEIMAPTRPDSFVQRFIDERRAGMHHIACEVSSVELAVAALREEGIEAHGGVIESEGWHRHTFIHPRDSGGVLFQLFEN